MSATAAFALFGVMWIAMRSRRLPVVSGAEELARSVAIALEDFDREGSVRVHGERWRARTATPVRAGDELRVISVADLVLRVEPRGTPQQWRETSQRSRDAAPSSRGTPQQ